MEVPGRERKKNPGWCSTSSESRLYRGDLCSVKWVEVEVEGVPLTWLSVWRSRLYSPLGFICPPLQVKALLA